MTDQNPSTPPWGDDFDAAKAWTLIQNLRTEKADLQTRLATASDEIETERQARTAAETALTEADGKIADAETRAKTTARDLYVERAVRKHELDESLVEFLTGDTEEEIVAKAERLATVGKPKGNKPEDKPGDKPADLPGKPKPNLTPGHGDGDTPPPNDPDAIVAAVRGNKF